MFLSTTVPRVVGYKREGIDLFLKFSVKINNIDKIPKLTLKAKIIKFLEENVGLKLCKLRSGTDY